MVVERVESPAGGSRGRSEEEPAGLDLWKRAGSGDAVARDELAVLAHSCAAAELQRRGASPDEVESLAQDAVVTILGFLDRGGAVRANLRGFLQYRARGVLSDHRKSLRSRKRLSEGDDPDHAHSSLPTPEGQSLQTELLRAVVECREELPPPLRETVERKYGGESSGSIGDALGIQRSTVNVRLFRAMEKLRDCLRRRGHRIA